MKVGNAMKKIVSLLISAATAAAVMSVAVIPVGATHLLMGDVNRDGMVTLRDATLAQRIELSLIAADNDQKYVADMDKSGTVQLADAYLIQRVASREKALLEDHDGVENSGYCPNRAQRTAFYEAVNAERKSRGLKEIDYTDAMMAAGQELCIQWQREREDPYNKDNEYYTGIRAADYAGSAGKGFPTVFADYGIKYGAGNSAEISASYAQYYDGASYFGNMQDDIEANGSESAYYNVYTNMLMNQNLSVLLVGEKKTGNTASWVIVCMYGELSS